MIDHVFRSELNGRISELLDNCLTLDDYLARVKELSKNSQTQHFNEHGFQALVEAIIEHREILKNHEVVQTFNHDLWVHGRGINLFGEPSTVGSFYVEDETQPLTANRNHLTSFFANSMANYGIDGKTPLTMLLFSNALSIHENTMQQFIIDQGLENVVFIRLKADIEQFINGNQDFWDYYRDNLTIEKKSSIKKKKPRPHQKGAIKKASKYDKGQIILPTGTGKSEIEAALIADTIQKNPQAVCLIATPRIVLTYQLINTIFEYLTSRKIEAKYVNLNSGDFDEDALKEAMKQAGLTPRDIPSTTNPKELEEAYYRSKTQNIPLIIGSTYHSAPKILHTSLYKEKLIDLYLSDEAHNLVMGRMADTHKRDNHTIAQAAKRKFFFTATPAYSGSDEDGTGMKNPELFGEIVYTQSPRAMIQQGEIVPPYIHKVSINELAIKQRLGEQDIVVSNEDLQNVESNIEVASLVVLSAYREHKETVKAKSFSPDKIGAKLLVVCKGEHSFRGFFNSKTMQDFRKQNPHVRFFGISSASGAFINGEDIGKSGQNYKEKFMFALRKMPDTQDAIIFHIDMIGEGIDVPGITGVMTFRDLGDLKSAQTLGRAMRLSNIDRVKVYKGEIQPLDFSKMVKPYAWVILPCYSWEMADSMARIKEMATRMREDLGYTPFQDVNGGNADGRLEQLTKEDFAKGKMPEVMRLLHEIEEPEFLNDAKMLIEAAQKDENVRRSFVDLFPVEKQELQAVEQE